MLIEGKDCRYPDKFKPMANLYSWRGWQLHGCIHMAIMIKKSWGHFSEIRSNIDIAMSLEWNLIRRVITTQK